MQTLTSTYVRTLNEVVSKTSSQSDLNLEHDKENESGLNDVVESTFEEFILAAAVAAAAGSSSSIGHHMHQNGDFDSAVDFKERLNDINKLSEELAEFNDDEDDEDEIDDDEEEEDDDEDDERDEDDEDDEDDEEDEDELIEEDEDEEEEDEDEDEIDEPKLTPGKNLLISPQSVIHSVDSLLQMVPQAEKLKESSESPLDKQQLLLKATLKKSKSKETDEAQSIKGNLLLFPSNSKITNESTINDCLNSLANPASILSKLIEFKSNVTSNDLVW